ncbi:MAG: hypothetical protein LBL13_10780, partial [Bacteroidales bacterium]|nr:hypothetical protein [Bacteroidales bacterium]
MDNITVRYEADTSGIDKVSNALDELKARERDLLNEIKKIDSEHGKLSNTIKTSGKTQKQIASELSAAEEDRVYMSKKLRAELDSTRKSIASLHEQADKLEKTISKGAANQSFIKQLRDTKQRMNELAMAGDTSSQAYTNLAIKAEKLKFQISSTEKTITTMASTTRNMDTVMGLGQGLTGTFTAATSAMALFSGENEELQKTFFKVQAAMQILNGVQMLNNVLVKNSTANIVLRNAMSKLFTRNKVAETAATVAHTTATGAETTATVAATVATKAWTMALLANPIFWIVGIIAGVIASISHFKSSLKSQLKIQNEINEKEKLHLEVLS